MGKKSDLSSIYRIQSDILDSKPYIKDIARCLEVPKIQTKFIEDWVQNSNRNFIQTKFIEDWVQNSNRNFKQSFKFSKLCKVQTEI